jgi:hypothetical protein
MLATRAYSSTDFSGTRCSVDSYRKVDIGSVVGHHSAPWRRLLDTVRGQFDKPQRRRAFAFARAGIDGCQ